VALSDDGTTAAISQPDNINSVRATGGGVHFFRSANGVWAAGETVTAPNLSTQNFGWSIALSTDGERLIVGDRGDKSSETGFDGLGEDMSAPGAGAVDAFSRTGSTWSWVHYVKPSNTYAGTLFGTSVAASRDALTVAVGSMWELSSAQGINGSQGTSSTAYGAVYVFH
jgi:hypothetical protein